MSFINVQSFASPLKELEFCQMISYKWKTHILMSISYTE